MLTRIAEGLALVRSDKRLIGVLVVTVIFNIFGWPFTGMIPVIGRDRLNLGPEGVGLLATMDGIGAFVGVLLAALWLTPRWYGQTYLGCVACYLIAVMMFALVQSPALAGAALLVTGLAGAGFATMQATLVYLAAPPDMRSRLLGVLTVCIGTGPIRFWARLARRPHRGAQRHGRDRRSGLAGHGRDLALVEGDLMEWRHA